MKIGVLSLQGAFQEHINMLQKLNVEAYQIKYAKQLDTIDGLIIPGGESSVIALLAEKNDLIKSIQNFYDEGKSIWGTCAGLIFLCKEIFNCPDQQTLGILDCQIKRNYYGPQIESSIKMLNYPTKFIKFNKDDKFEAVLIRAPGISAIYDNSIEILLKDEDIILAVQKDNILGTSFHPELTNNSSWHEYFISMVKNTLIQ